MRSSIERLRVGLLVGAAVLVAVIAGFLGYAHYRAHRILKDLPGMLGATITKEFNGYTYSQSLKGKTVFTLHAAKAVQRKDGTYTLHDVAMTMYGRRGDRNDHISGAQFEYDEKAGVVRAVGVVHLDLQAADSAAGLAGGLPVAGRAGSARSSKASRVIHVTTSGLVYTQKLGVAATPEAIEFDSNGLRGHAVGAEYDSDTGHVVLQTAVRVEGTEQGKAVLLTATHAELDRQAEVADLVTARYSSEGDTAESDRARVHLRADGSADSVAGEGHVRLTRQDEGAVTSERAEVALDAANKPQRAVLHGMVRYAEDDPLRQARAAANEALVHFDAAGRVEHVSLHGGAGGVRGGIRGGASAQVQAEERLLADAKARRAESTRTVMADTVELALVPDAAGRAVLHEAEAIGGARLSSVGVVASAVGSAGGGGVGSVRAGARGSGAAGGVVTRRLAGDRLTAEFVERGGAAEIASLEGAGQTMVEQVDAAGVDEVSRAPRLAVRFHAAAHAGGAAAAKAGGAGAVVDTAVQEGGVAVTRTTPALVAGSSPRVVHAAARRAVYTGDSDRLSLLEEVRVTDETSALTADRVDTEQASGDALAIGNVKVTYLQGGDAGGVASGGANGSQPVHVVSAWAEMKHSSGVATFYGMGFGASAVTGELAGELAAGNQVVLKAAGPKLARMWQPGSAAGGNGEAGGGAGGGSQVEAPVLVFASSEPQGASRAGAATMGRMTARGDGDSSAMAVRAVLVSMPAAHAAGGRGGVGLDAAQSGGVRSARSAAGGAARASGQAGSANHGPQVIRVASREMVYTDADRLAEFTGGVRVIDGDGVMRAAEAKVFLAAASASGASAAGASAAGSRAGGAGALRGPSGMLGGSVERIVATGAIDIRQPGRVATGERLVYTAADQMFVLTGTKTAPPKVVSAEQGTATGVELRFHTGDDSVVIAGGDGSAGAVKAHTETKVKK